MRAGEVSSTGVASAVVVAFALATTACGPSPAYTPARVPPNAVRVVPADQVKGTCVCDDREDEELDDDDDDEPRRRRARPVEYVKIREWEPPAAVQDFEASNPPRGDAPATYTHFPKLTLHTPIPSSSFRSRTWLHAR